MKEVTYEDWQKNPIPRMMWVWNDSFEDKKKAKVICVLKSECVLYPVMTVTEEYVCYCTYKHCAEIEEPKTRRMTNQELAWWLQDGKHREYKASSRSGINSSLCYTEAEANEPVYETTLIRENGSEWHEPLVEVEE